MEEVKGYVPEHQPPQKITSKVKCQPLMPDAAAKETPIQQIQPPVELLVAKVKEEILEMETETMMQNDAFSQFHFPSLAVEEQQMGPSGSATNAELKLEPVDINMECNVQVANQWDIPVLEVIKSVKTETDNVDDDDYRPPASDDEDDDEDEEWKDDEDNKEDSDYDPLVDELKNSSHNSKNLKGASTTKLQKPTSNVIENNTNPIDSQERKLSDIPPDRPFQCPLCPDIIPHSVKAYNSHMTEKHKIGVDWGKQMKEVGQLGSYVLKTYSKEKSTVLIPVVKSPIIPEAKPKVYKKVRKVSNNKKKSTIVIPPKVKKKSTIVLPPLASLVSLTPFGRGFIQKENPEECEKVRSAFSNIWKDLLVKKKKKGTTTLHPVGTTSVLQEPINTDKEEELSDECQIIETHSLVPSEVDEDYEPKKKRRKTGNASQTDSSNTNNKLPKQPSPSQSSAEDKIESENSNSQTDNTSNTAIELPKQPKPQASELNAEVAELSFKCKDCSLGFNKRSQLRVHRRCCVHNLKTSIPKQKCSECEFECKNSQLLEQHILTDHLYLNETQAYENSFMDSLKDIYRQRINQCKFCGDRFIRRAYLTRHLRIHTNERPYQCSSCKQKFYRRDTLKTHIKRDHPEGANIRTLKCKKKDDFENKRSEPDVHFQCTTCQTFLNSPQLMLTHNKKYHLEKSVQEPNLLSCMASQNSASVKENGQDSRAALCTKVRFRECSITISKKSCVAFRENKLESTFKNIFTSVKTGSSPATSTSFNYSVQDHEVDQLSDSEYETDYEDHSTERPNSNLSESVLSDVWSSDEDKIKTSQSKSKAQKSTSSSENEEEIIFQATTTVLSSLPNSFSCDTCGNKFNNETVYKRHLRLHETSFVCWFCKNSFSTQEELLKHCDEHKKNFVNGALNQVYPCHLCTRTFSKKIGLKIHLKIHKVAQKPPNNQKINEVPIRSKQNDFAPFMAIAKTIKDKVTQVATVVAQDETSKTDTVKVPEVEDGLPCLLCDLKFSSSNELIQHYRVHQNKSNPASSSAKSIAPEKPVSIPKDQVTLIVEPEVTRKRSLRSHTPITPSLTPSASTSLERITAKKSSTPSILHIDQVKVRHSDSVDQSALDDNSSNVTKGSDEGRNWFTVNQSVEIYSSWNKSLRIGTRATWNQLNKKDLIPKRFGLNGCTFPRCRCTFQTIEESLKHIKKHAYIYKCSECCSEFGYKNTLEIHYKTRHIKAASTQSDSDQDSFSESESVLEMDSDDEGNYSCTFPSCLRKFTSLSRMKSHQRSHKIYKCSKCNRVFGHQNTLLRHMRSMHKNKDADVIQGDILEVDEDEPDAEQISNSNDNDTFDKNTATPITKSAEVSGCQKSNTTEIIDITKDKTENKTFICKKCGKDLTSRERMDHHLETCKSRYLGSLSTVGLKSKRSIKSRNSKARSAPQRFLEVEYMKVKSNTQVPSSGVQQNGLLCPVGSCKKKFATRELAQKHQQKVHPQTCFCLCCGKWLQIRHYFKNHIQKCNPEILEKEEHDTTQYIRNISFSSKSSSRKNSTDTAERSEDLTDNGGSNTTNEYTCSFCNIIFTNEVNHRDHMLTTHAYAPVTFSCGICQEICTDENKLLKHIQENHPNAKKHRNSPDIEIIEADVTEKSSDSLMFMFSCKFCKKKFDLKSNLRLHINKFHRNEIKGSQNNNQSASGAANDQSVILGI